MLKQEIRDVLIRRAEQEGLDGEQFIDKIADEKTATTEEEVLAFITSAKHPALAMDPMF